MDTYRDWEIRQGRWPEPAWIAVHKDYDADWQGEEDGWVANIPALDGPSREAVIEEIDNWYEEKAEADRAAVLKPFAEIDRIFTQASPLSLARSGRDENE